MESSKNISENGMIALNLAKQGWYVFPCHECEVMPNDYEKSKKRKSPYWNSTNLKNGHHDATLDQNFIMDWWQSWPNALVGIYCQKSGFFAIDIDKKNGKDGFVAFEQILNEHQGKDFLDVGPKQRTPNGGMHLFFRLPTPHFELPNNASVLGSGLDIRCNGYVCTGNNYEWLDGHEWSTGLTLAPEWLINKIITRSKNMKGNILFSGNNSNIVSALIEKALKDAEIGTRNNVGFTFACNLRNAGVNLPIAIKAMAEYSSKVPGDGYTKREAMATLKSAYRYSMKDKNYSIDNADNKSTKGFVDNEEEISIERLIKAIDDKENGDAQLFSELFIGKFIFDISNQKWLFWDGQHWKTDSTGEIYRAIANDFASHYYNAASVVLQEKVYPDLAKIFKKRAGSLRTKYYIENVLFMVSKQNGMFVENEKWTSDPFMLGVENGILDLRNGQLRPNNPSDFVTSFSPTAWKGLHFPAPKWAKFINEVFGNNQELNNFIQRLFGYSISGLSTEHIFPILWGEGRNGKSTLIETIADVLGSDLAMSSQSDSLMSNQFAGDGPKPFVHALKGKRLVWVSESNKNNKLNIGLIKQLTGGDRINVRTLNRLPTEFKPTHLIFFISNHRPKISGDDQAIWDRVLLIPFKNRFVDQPVQINEIVQNKQLKNELSNEFSGILAWLVQGFMKYLESGLNPPEIVKVETKLYRQKEEGIKQFIDECCIICNDGNIAAGELYNAYLSWCKQNSKEAVNATAFGIEISKTYHKSRKGNCKTYFGLKLN